MTATAKRERSFYGGKLPFDVPRYFVPDVAIYARMPESTLTSWLQGSDPLIARPDQSDPRLSFSNVFEAFVLRAIRSSHKVSMRDVRKAMDYVKNRKGVDRLLLDPDLRVFQKSLFFDKLGQLMNISRDGQIVMRGVLAPYMKRLTWDQVGRPRRFAPMTQGKDNPASPTHVVIDPRIAFGHPVVSGKFVRTVVLAERYYAGETEADIASDYGLEVEAVGEAIRYEAFRKREAA